MCLCFYLLRTFKYKKLAKLKLIKRTKEILINNLGNTDDFCSIYQQFSIFYAQTNFRKQVRNHGWVLFNLPTILHLLCANKLSNTSEKSRMIFVQFTNYFASFMRKQTFQHKLGNTDDFCSIYQLLSIFYAQTNFMGSSTNDVMA